MQIDQHVDGQPVLVDTGTYRYNGAPAWRRAVTLDFAAEIAGHPGDPMRPEREAVFGPLVHRLAESRWLWLWPWWPWPRSWP